MLKAFKEKRFECVLISKAMEPNISIIDVSEEGEPSSTPRLAIFSSSWELPEPQGTKTPPLIAPVSIPFQWEEAPGKPKALESFELTTSRSLHLPPRLQLLVDRSNSSIAEREVESPSKHFWPRRSTSLKFLSSSTHAEFDSPSVPTQQHRGIIRHSFGDKTLVDSPRSILNGFKNSWDSSASSHDSAASVVAEGHDVVCFRDETPKKHGQVWKKTRRFLDLWATCVRWQKNKKPQNGCGYEGVSSIGSEMGFLELNPDDVEDNLQNLPEKLDDGFSVHGVTGVEGMEEKMPTFYSSAKHGSDIKGKIGAQKKKKRIRWVIRRKERSSRFFGAIWKRVRNRVSVNKRRLIKCANQKFN